MTVPNKGGKIYSDGFGGLEAWPGMLSLWRVVGLEDEG